MLDAVGTTINLLNRSATGKVLFVISTDGYENSSREFTRKDIKKLISIHEDWEFLFLGADIDSFAEANSLGIHSSHAANYKHSSRSVDMHWRSIGRASSSIANGRKLDDGNWKEELER